MKIDKDDRKWIVRLNLRNEECPHLFFPNDIHGCKVLNKFKKDDIRCRMELCPFRDTRSAIKEGE